MELYKTPEILIVHFKRFSHQRGFFGGRKINDFIGFPVKGLNLTDYVISEDPEQKNAIYDLYAVSNHYGSMNGGHYIAFAKNPVVDNWFEFDDSDVSRMDESKVVNKAAYVLFYKRRRK